jgi:pyruvate/2-oxoglutarate dehydrogenase complex dihydrolipoamide acyltransferase (E2) component
MAERIFMMPDLGEGLEEGEIVAWLVAEGEAVELNQPLVEVETAKATVEIPSPFAGVVASLHGAVGEAVAVGAPLASFTVAPVGGVGASGAGGREGPVAATPAVRRLAKTLGVDLAGVVGSGVSGRVTDEDVRAAAGVGGVAPETQGFDVEPISVLRRTIAERLTASVREVPHVTTFRTLDCTELTAYRKELGVSPLPVFVKAVAETCRAHPILHASWHDDLGEIHVPHACHVGIAADTERGLVVPVVHDVWDRSIGTIDGEIKRLAEAARSGSLVPEEMSAGTISVSNTGSYGSEAGTPIINPGQAAVIALGMIAPRALVIDGEIHARLACTISLSFDHRLMDGATAGHALTFLVDLLQNAARLRDLLA